MTNFARNRDFLEYMFSLPKHSNMLYNILTASNENTVISILNGVPQTNTNLSIVRYSKQRQ